MNSVIFVIDSIPISFKLGAVVLISKASWHIPKTSAFGSSICNSRKWESYRLTLSSLDHLDSLLTKLIRMKATTCVFNKRYLLSYQSSATIKHSEDSSWTQTYRKQTFC